MLWMQSSVVIKINSKNSKVRPTNFTFEKYDCNA